MLTKTKNKFVILKKEKRSYPQNLASIHAVVSEKPEFMDDGRLRHDSSSAGKVKQS